MQFLGESRYRISVQPLNREVILSNLRLKQEQQQLNEVYLDFSNFENKSMANVSGLLKEMLQYFKGVNEIGFFLKNATPDYKILEFTKELDELTSLFIKCHDKESLDVAFSILEKVSLRKIKTFSLGFTKSMEEPKYHTRILKVLKSMSKLEDLTLEFSNTETVPTTKPRKMSLPVRSLQIEGETKIYQYYLPLFPDLIKVNFQPYYRSFQLDSNILSHLTQLEELSIQSLDNISLKNLKNLKYLSITDSISPSINFGDMVFLDKLQKFKIVPALNISNSIQLNQISTLPKGCSLEIRTLYLSLIKNLGKIPGVQLKIDNQCLCTTKDSSILPSYMYWKGVRGIENLIDMELQICHGEAFTDVQILNFVTDLTYCPNLVQLKVSFFIKRERQACSFTKEQENAFAMNTNLLFLDTDLHISERFSKYLLQRIRSFYSFLAFEQFIKPELSINPAACYFDLVDYNP